MRRLKQYGGGPFNYIPTPEQSERITEIYELLPLDERGNKPPLVKLQLWLNAQGIRAFLADPARAITEIIEANHAPTPTPAAAPAPASD